jgi:hypothetical protein
MRDLRRWSAWLAGLWAGLLATIALVAAPSAFAVLARPEAGRLVARLFAIEARASVAAGVVLLLLDRVRTRRAGTSPIHRVSLALLAAILCTVAGYFAIEPMMAQARAGQGRWSFGALHAASTVFYGLRTLAVALAAWWLAAEPPGRGPVPSALRPPPTS